MISVTGKEWKEQLLDKNSIEKLKQDHNFSDILTRLILQRNFNKEEIFSINNNLDIKNVFKNTEDFNKAILIAADSIKKEEKICILGDYDVDGSSATSLLVRFFNSISHPNFFYIPDRVKDGYGASVELFQKLILKKPKLIIMVDCGSTSNKAINFLNENNIKSIIIDHHEINKPFPDANSIINPKKNNGYIKYDYFCATTLVYFFLDLLIIKLKSKMNIKDFLIYVLLATICDVMPLRKLNRLISLNIIKKFKVNSNKLFKEIYSLNKKKNGININDLGYLIGPILNSGGRLGKSNYATKLLSSDNDNLINKLSIELIKLNEKRKIIENSILKEIDYDKISRDNKDIIIYYDPNINEGLIGIIASRLKDYFNKPSIVITSSGNILKGSARSIYNYNIGRVIKNAFDENMILAGGGHIMAAGFTLQKSKILDFNNFMIKSYLKDNHLNNNVFFYDAEVSSSAFNKEFLNDIKKIEPHGNGNPIPTFFFKDLQIIKTSILKDKHVSAILKSKTGRTIKSIAFNTKDNKIGEYLLNYKKKLNVLGQIQENFWNNKNSLQLTIKDLIL